MKIIIVMMIKELEVNNLKNMLGLLSNRQDHKIEKNYRKVRKNLNYR